jgi:hypothetical protein
MEKLHVDGDTGNSDMEEGDKDGVSGVSNHSEAESSALSEITSNFFPSSDEGSSLVKTERALGGKARLGARCGPVPSRIARESRGNFDFFLVGRGVGRVMSSTIVVIFSTAPWISYKEFESSSEKSKTSGKTMSTGTSSPSFLRILSILARRTLAKPARWAGAAEGSEDAQDERTDAGVDEPNVGDMLRVSISRTADDPVNANLRNGLSWERLLVLFTGVASCSAETM